MCSSLEEFMKEEKTDLSISDMMTIYFNSIDYITKVRGLYNQVDQFIRKCQNIFVHFITYWTSHKQVYHLSKYLLT